MTNDKMITAVLFDWDFTLAYTLSQNTSYDERTAIMFQRAGVPCTLQEMQEVRAAQAADIKDGLVAILAHPQEKADFFLLYEDILQRLGVKKITNTIIYNIYAQYAQLPTYLYDDVLSTLQTLQDCGFRLGVLSNHTTAVRTAIEQLVGQYILSEHITISEEVGFHKPDPQIYQIAAQKIATPAEQCLYVGDNLRIDAFGAVEQGRFAEGLWLDRNDAWQGQDFPQHVARIDNLSQIIDLHKYACAPTLQNEH